MTDRDISDRERRDLFDDLDNAIGTSAADTLMQLLPHQPADQLVTRTDMHAETIMLRGEMAELRAELRGEMAELRTELTGQMAELRTDVVTGISQLHTEVHNEIADLKVWVQRWVSGAAAANLVAVVTALAF